MYQKILLSCLLLITLSACPKEPPTVIVDVEDDFYIDMFEDISNGNQLFQLDITTIKKQTCLNYQIDYSLNFNEQSNDIELIINDLVEPTDCEMGDAAATLTVPFGTLASGVYDFDINLKDAVINKGSLSVYSDRYELSMDSDDGIQIVNQRLNRIPMNTIWGYVAYDDDSAEANANRFLDDLDNLSSTFDVKNNALFLEGYYGYFNLDAQKTLFLSNEINFNNHQVFIYQHDGNGISEITDLKNEACDGLNNLEIQVFTNTGAIIKCN